MGYSNLCKEIIAAHPNNYTNPRKYPVSKFTPHHMAGNLTAQACARMSQDPNRQASYNYAIGSDGTIVGTLDELYRPWTSSDYENDHKAITVEVANDTGAPNWHISDAAWNSLVLLAVDVCRRHNFRLTYDGTKDASLTRHNMFASTSCCGTYLQSRLPELAQKVNAILDGGSTPQPTPPAPQPTNKKHIYKLQEVQKINGYWQLRCDYLVPTGFNWVENGILLNDITFVNINGNPVSQVWDGSQQYFTIDGAQETGKSGVGTGGYFWKEFKTPTATSMWMSANNLNDLLYRNYENGM